MPRTGVVILSQDTGPDPRDREPPAECSGANQSRRDRTTIRVTLDVASRVAVEVQDGTDGVGAPHWIRLDNREDARAAYSILEGILASYYDRMIDAEGRAVAAETRALKAEQARAELPGRGKVSFGPALPDPRAAAKIKLAKLLSLATSDNENEARSAALSAVRLMRENNLVPK